MSTSHTDIVAAPRHKPGRGSQVTPNERREIQRMYLADGLTKAAIAQKTGRTRETIAGVLQRVRILKPSHVNSTRR
jgi:IS30 family transposase